MFKFDLLKIFNDLPHPAVIYKAVDDGDDFLFVEVNLESQATDGIDLDKVIGKRLTECFPGVREFGLLDVLKTTYLTGQRGHLPTKMYQDNKLTGHRENWVYKLDDDHVIALYHDRDDYIRIYNSLEEQKTIALESAHMAQIGEISASISHEIRNPLNLISGRIQLLLMQLESLSKDEIKMFLSKMHEETKEITTITSSVLDLSRGSHSTNKVEIEPIEIVNKSLPYFSKKLKKFKVDLKIESLINDEIKLNCIPIQIQQILTNLISNSLESVASINSPWISLIIKENNGFLQFIISDSGDEIPQELLTKIGTKLFTTKGNQGTGLGLYLSKKIAQEHGGELRVSNKNSHPCFELSLPL